MRKNRNARECILFTLSLYLCSLCRAILDWCQHTNMSAVPSANLTIGGSDGAPTVDGARNSQFQMGAGSVPQSGAVGWAMNPPSGPNTQLLRTGSMFPGEGRAMAHHQEEDHYRNLVIRSREIVADLMLGGDEIWTLIAPVIELDPKTAVGKIDWIKWKFEPRYPELAPKETTGPLVTMYSESHSAHLVRHHMGVEAEITEASTTKGLEILRRKLAHLVRMIKADERRDILATYRDTPDMWGRIMEGRGIKRHQSIQQVHGLGAERYGIVAKPGHAFWKFDEMLRGTMSIEGAFPNLILLTQGVSSHLRMVADGFDHAKIGYRADDNLNVSVSKQQTLAGGDRVVLNDFRGSMVMEVGPVDLTFLGHASSNPLSRNTEVGEYFKLGYTQVHYNAANITASMLSVAITNCDYNRGDYSIIHMYSALDNCGYFNPTDGSLHANVHRMCADINAFEDNGTPGWFSSSNYQTNYKTDRGNGPDMFGLGDTPSLFVIMDHSGNRTALRPINVIGEMHPKYDPETRYFSMLGRILAARLRDALGSDKAYRDWSEKIRAGLALVDTLGAGLDDKNVGEYAAASALSTVTAASPGNEAATLARNGFGAADPPTTVAWVAAGKDGKDAAKKRHDEKRGHVGMSTMFGTGKLSPTTEGDADVYNGGGLITWPAIKTMQAVSKIANDADTLPTIYNRKMLETYNGFVEAVEMAAATLERLVGMGNPVFDGTRLPPWLRANPRAGITVADARKLDRVTAFAHNVILPSMDVYGFLHETTDAGATPGPQILEILLHIIGMYDEVYNVSGIVKAAQQELVKDFEDATKWIIALVVKGIQTDEHVAESGDVMANVIIGATVQLRKCLEKYIAASRAVHEDARLHFSAGSSLGVAYMNIAKDAEEARKANVLATLVDVTADAKKAFEWPFHNGDVKTTHEHLKEELKGVKDDRSSPVASIAAILQTRAKGKGEGGATNGAILVPMFGLVAGTPVPPKLDLVKLPTYAGTAALTAVAPGVAFTREAPREYGGSTLAMRPLAHRMPTSEAHHNPRRGSKRRPENALPEPPAHTRMRVPAMARKALDMAKRRMPGVAEKMQAILKMLEDSQEEYDAGTPYTPARSLINRWDAACDEQDPVMGMTMKTALFIAPNQRVFRAMLKASIPIAVQFLLCRRGERHVADSGLWIDTRSQNGPGAIEGPAAHMFRGKRDLNWTRNGQTGVMHAQWAAWYKCVIEDTRKYHLAKDIALREYLGGGGIKFINPLSFALEGNAIGDNGPASGGSIVARCIGPGLGDENIPNPLCVLGYVPDHDPAAIERPGNFEADVQRALDYSEAQYYSYITHLPELLTGYMEPPVIPTRTTVQCDTIPGFFTREGATRNIWLWRGAERHIDVTGIHSIPNEPTIGPFVGMNERGFVDRRCIGSYRGVSQAPAAQVTVI